MDGLRKNNTSHRAVFFLLSLTLFAMLGFFVPTTYAQNIENLQAQIEALLEQVASLQEQINSLEGVPAELVPSTIEGPPGVVISTFARDLRFGDKSTEVKELQKVLNSDPATRVAFFGPGSPGEETDFFGNLTKSAVIKFQEKYTKEILVPVGLSRGTGFVGPSTRAKINTLITKSTQASKPEKPDREEKVSDGTSFLDVVEVVEQKSTQAPDVFQEHDTLIISFPSAYEGLPGVTVTLSGLGFTRTGNTVHLGNRALSDISSVSGTSIVFTIPDDMPKGKHSLFVSNTKGTSNENFFVVAGSLQQNPVIESSAPAEGLYGTEVTITGSGFTTTGNDVYTSFDIITNLPSPDGKTLKFSVLPFPEIPELQVGVNLGQGIEWPVWFYVVNENGISETSSKFVLKI